MPPHDVSMETSLIGSCTSEAFLNKRTNEENSFSGQSPTGQSRIGMVISGYNSFSGQSPTGHNRIAMLISGYFNFSLVEFSMHVMSLRIWGVDKSSDQ